MSVSTLPMDANHEYVNCLTKYSTWCGGSSTIAKSHLAWDLSPPDQNGKMVRIKNQSPAAAAIFTADVIRLSVKLGGAEETFVFLE